MNATWGRGGRDPSESWVRVMGTAPTMLLLLLAAAAMIVPTVEGFSPMIATGFSPCHLHFGDSARLHASSAPVLRRRKVIVFVRFNNDRRICQTLSVLADGTIYVSF